MTVVAGEERAEISYEHYYQWNSENRSNAIEGLKKDGTTAYMEMYFFPLDGPVNISQAVLLGAARSSQIQTFGFPIAPVFEGDLGPKPVNNGIIAEIPPVDKRGDYHYWSLSSSGSFYALEGMFEDTRSDDDAIYYNTRITKITEVFLYCNRLCKNLGYDDRSRFRMGIKHYGLKNRKLSAVSRLVRHRGVSMENQVEKEIDIQLSEVDDNLVFLVKAFAAPMFVLFDYFELPDAIYEDIVNSFINRKIV